MHKRIGDEVKQDKVVTLDVTNKLVEELKRDFLAEQELATSNVTMFILASFLGGLRGEDAFKIVLGEIRQYIVEAENHCNHKHVILSLRGRFKGETGESFYLLAVTAKIDLDFMIGASLKRSILLKEKTVVTRGFLFVDKK